MTDKEKIKELATKCVNAMEGSNCDELAWCKEILALLDECPTCFWSQCNDTDVYSTMCGNMWEFTEGGPKENHIKHCMYCGRLIENPCPDCTSKEPDHIPAVGKKVETSELLKTLGSSLTDNEYLLLKQFCAKLEAETKRADEAKEEAICLTGGVMDLDDKIQQLQAENARLEALDKAHEVELADLRRFIIDLKAKQ